MRLIPSLILALASVFTLHLPTASAADLLGPEPSEQPIKQALAETTEAEIPLLLQSSTGLLGSSSKKVRDVDSLEEHPDLWERIRDGFAMEELDSPLVQNHVAWYANRPDYVKRMVERSQLYLYHIVEEVEKRGMPTEVALLPMIESAFNPKAYSTSHASGIWQFIPSTGKHFGLEQNWWYDGRRDVTAATMRRWTTCKSSMTCSATGNWRSPPTTGAKARCNAQSPKTGRKVCPPTTSA